MGSPRLCGHRMSLYHPGETPQPHPAPVPPQACPAPTAVPQERQLHSLPNPAGLFCAKALFCDEKRLPPVLVVPKRLFDVPVDVPKPKPVLVEEVAGWLKVVEPNSPPADRNRLFILPGGSDGGCSGLGRVFG